MSLVRRKVAVAAAEEAQRLNATVSFYRGGRHTQLEVTVGDQKRHTAISQKQGDNCVDWVRQKVRRLVKDIQSCNMVTP